MTAPSPSSQHNRPRLIAVSAFLLLTGFMMLAGALVPGPVFLIAYFVLYLLGVNPAFYYFHPYAAAPMLAAFWPITFPIEEVRRVSRVR